MTQGQHSNTSFFNILVPAVEDSYLAVMQSTTMLKEGKEYENDTASTTVGQLVYMLPDIH